jgi:hypothetical protein
MKKKKWRREREKKRTIRRAFERRGKKGETGR